MTAEGHRATGTAEGERTVETAGVHRTATLDRTTRESTVHVEIDLDGSGRSRIATGVPFWDHMLTALATHGMLDLVVQATGDVAVDVHHTVEDSAIVLGQAVRSALGDRAGITRFGDATVPLDEALARAVVDVSGRPYCVCTGEPPDQRTVLIGGHFTGSLTAHVMESIAFGAGITVHLQLLAGRDPHHIVEAQVKAFARALRAAVEPDPRRTGVPSTKGVL